MCRDIPTQIGNFELDSIGKIIRNKNTKSGCYDYVTLSSEKEKDTI